MPVLSGFLEKSGKYTKSWVKRFMMFDTEACKLEYGESQQKMKSAITVSKIVRSSETNAKVVAGSPDLYSFTVEGKLVDGKADTYAVRCPDAASFEEWFFAIRHALGRSGAMDPFNYGLPERDPRTNLNLVHVPVEHLFRFNLLDRAILYTFQEVSVASSTGNDDSTELLIIGDRYLYLFYFTAEVHRCVPLTAVKNVYAGSGVIGIQLTEPQHDILIANCLTVAQITQVLMCVLRAIPNSSQFEPNTSIATREGIEKKLHLSQYEGYNLKVMAPTPKMKLKAAMDVYEKQTGQSFVYGSAAKPAPAIAKNAVHNAPAAIDVEDPMAVLLLKLGMQQYIVQLQRQHVDLGLLSCIDADDLANFGIEVRYHREVIAAGAKGEPIPQEPGASSPRGAANPIPQAFVATTAASATPASPIIPRTITLSDSDDDLPGPTKPSMMPVARPMITLSSDDDDDLPVTVPVAKPIRLDSDDDLPGPIGMKAPPAAILADDDI
jgi:hypothetical protein